MSIPLFVTLIDDGRARITTAFSEAYANRRGSLWYFDHSGREVGVVVSRAIDAAIADAAQRTRPPPL